MIPMEAGRSFFPMEHFIILHGGKKGIKMEPGTEWQDRNLPWNWKKTDGM